MKVLLSILAALLVAVVAIPVFAADDGNHAVYLPDVGKIDTPTPTFTPTVTPTLTPTATPIPTATPEVKRWIEDGTYIFESQGFDDNAGAWITFTVSNDGAKVNQATFIIDMRGAGPGYERACYPTGWSFVGSKEIDNGHFTFIDMSAVGRLDTSFAKMECYAVSPTSADCKVRKPQPIKDSLLVNLPCYSARAIVPRAH